MNKNRLFTLPEKSKVQFGDVYFIKDRKNPTYTHPWLVISKQNTQKSTLVEMSTSFSDEIPVIGMDSYGNYMVAFANPLMATTYTTSFIQTQCMYVYTVNENLTELIQKIHIAHFTNEDVDEMRQAYIDEFRARYKDIMPDFTNRVRSAIMYNELRTRKEAELGIIPPDKIKNTFYNRNNAEDIEDEEDVDATAEDQEESVSELPVDTKKHRYGKDDREMINTICDTIIAGTTTRAAAAEALGLSLQSINRYVLIRQKEQQEKEKEFIALIDYDKMIRNLIAKPMSVSDEIKNIATAAERVAWIIKHDGTFNGKKQKINNRNLEKNEDIDIYIYTYCYQKYGANATSAMYTISNQNATDLYYQIKDKYSE